ncbi:MULTISPECIES: response regulator transcription factor [Gracilibacillus]|uniref:response regulator transcription factor n=1 Tax=Gracilibacillus TaxID=74385 RepID=UPI0008247F7A|nr:MULTISPECIES: response regulator transcription factor [Gracilibacillus]
MEDILKKLDIFVLEDDLDISRFLDVFLGEYFQKVVVKTDNRFDDAIFDELDIFLLDIEIPFDSGYEICKRIKTMYPEKPVVFLTAHSQIDDKIKGLELGDDFIPKPFEPLELIARLKNVLRDRYGKIMYLDQIAVDTRTQTIFHCDPWMEIPLSKTESKLFFYLCDNIHLSLSREQIIHHIWGTDGAGSQANSLSVYMNSLRQKIDAEGRLIQTIYGYGYKMVNPEERDR